MSLPVVLRAEAEAEFDEAFDFHENARPGRGVRFADRVRRVLRRIAVRPLAHRVVMADLRRAVVPKLPYCVYYRADAIRVEVLAVFHTSRDPSIWQGRI